MVRRKKLVLWGIVIAVLGVAAMHRLILRAAVSGLIAADPVDACDTLILVGGDRDYAIAAELYQQGKAGQLLLLRSQPRPLYICGIVEPREVAARREILQRGVPETDVMFSTDSVRGIWDIADAVRKQLAASPQQRVGLLADLLVTGRLRYVLNQTLSASELARLRIHAVRDRRYDETNWWRTRIGIRELTLGYLRLLHHWAIGRPEPFTPPEWSPEWFEQQLQTRNPEKVAFEWERETFIGSRRGLRFV